MLGFIFIMGSGFSAQAGGKGLKLQKELDMAAADDPIPIIIKLVGSIDLKKHKEKRKALSKVQRQSKELKARHRSELIKELKTKSDGNFRSLEKFLKQQGVKKKDIKVLWMINSVAVTIPAELVNMLEARPEVESLKLDVKVAAPGGTSAAGSSSPPEWNIAAIRAPELWALGYDGSGIVVASMDSGVDYLHPDIGPKWRGGSNSWYDPNEEHATAPYDKSGHGTWGMGLMVGGDSGGSAIGVAPGAQWIAVKIFADSGDASLSSIHLGFQWLLDPDDNPDVDDAPDIVNNSWYLQNTVNQCETEFEQDIDTLKTAGIAVVFSAGNTGPYIGSSVSPSNNFGSLAVGAMGAWNDFQYVAGFSARGPSACSGSFYPEIVAPGVEVFTADRTLGGVFPDSYITVSGTSFAAPHVSAAMALLLSANPYLTPSELESALKLSAMDMDPAGLDDDSGNGLIDVMAAYQSLANEPAAPVAADDNYEVMEGNTLNVAPPGVLANDSDGNGDPLTVLLNSPPTNGSVTLYGDGSFDYTPEAGFSGTDSFTYAATDGTLDSDLATVNITVTPVPGNDAPVANNDSATTDADLAVVIDVLANDTDTEGDALSITAVSQGGNGAVVNNGGDVTYTPDPGFSGSDSFSYTANDGTQDSNPATVTVTVNEAVTADKLTCRRASYIPDKDKLIIVVKSNDLPKGLRTITGTVDGGAPFTIPVKTAGSALYKVVIRPYPGSASPVGSTFTATSDLGGICTRTIN